MEKWKDRDWWVSVDLDRMPSGRKNEGLALDLLARARERYDLLLESGKTVARGIFTGKVDLMSLSRLLEIAARWKGTIVYSNGNLLDTGVVNQLAKLLLCAANQPGCRSRHWEHRLAYLGCHLMRIGLVNYSLANLKKGSRYWFSYLKSEKGGFWHISLDKSALTKVFESTKLCPLFPEKTPALIEMLPSAVNLKPANNQLFWVPTKQKIRTSWLCRFPPVVPKSEIMYRQWIRLKLSEFHDTQILADEDKPRAL
jgi:hypothetical protein